jgi:nucleoside-diphosphate-sugar epimerase
VKGPLAPPVRSTRLAVRGGATSSPLMDAAAGGKPLDVLVTGGVGYIGSHTVVELLNAGHNVIIVDNLCNSNEECLVRVKRITGKTVLLYKCDVRDADGLDKIFKAHKIDAVIHFAGLKAVGESVAKPLEYYDCNVNGAVSLLQTMAKNGVKQIVFSSSATVYGDPASVPVDETLPTSATNPYGQTKLMIEHILEDLAKSDPEWQVSVLRYFNPVGAHASGLIGEDPKGIPNNLMPFIQQVAIGVRAELSIFGSDYPTPDGALHPRPRPLRRRPPRPCEPDLTRSPAAISSVPRTPTRPPRRAARRHRRARLHSRRRPRQGPPRRAAQDDGRARRVRRVQPRHGLRLFCPRDAKGVRARERPPDPLQARRAPGGRYRVRLCGHHVRRGRARLASRARARGHVRRLVAVDQRQPAGLRCRHRRCRVVVDDGRA